MGIKVGESHKRLKQARPRWLDVLQRDARQRGACGLLGDVLDAHGCACQRTTPRLALLARLLRGGEWEKGGHVLTHLKEPKNLAAACALNTAFSLQPGVQGEGSV